MSFAKHFKSMQVKEKLVESIELVKVGNVSLFLSMTGFCETRNLSTRCEHGLTLLLQW